MSIENLKTHRTWKNHLPSYFKLKRFHFDIDLIQKEILEFAPEFANVFEANHSLCMNHPTLTDSVKEHYEQVSLTVFNNEKVSNAQPTSVISSQSSVSFTSEYRKKISPRLDSPDMDERNYDFPSEKFKNSYMHQCVKQMPGDFMRVRLVKLKAGKTVDFHIDYDPSFATRIILPIYTNSQCYNLTKRKGQIEQVHVPADGHPWFLNTGFSHASENKGDTDRIILMFSLYPTDLLAEIAQAWRAGQPELL